MDKKEAINKALQTIADYYKKDFKKIQELYLVSHSIDYVLFRLDREIKRGF